MFSKKLWVVFAILAASGVLFLLASPFPAAQAHKSAFTVWSQEDGTLYICNRSERPVEGSTFKKARVSKVEDFDLTEKKSRSLLDDNAALLVRRVVVLDRLSPKYCAEWFSGFRNCKGFDLEKLDTSKTKSFSRMFYGCENVEELDLGNFKGEAARDFSWMFCCCYNLEAIDLNSLAAPEGIDFSRMFYCCYKLESIDLNSLVASEGVDFSQMFFGCSALDELEIDSIKPAKGEDFTDMFANCGVLELDCSDWKAACGATATGFDYDAPGVIQPEWIERAAAWQPGSVSSGSESEVPADTCKAPGCTNSPKNKCGYCNSHHSEYCDDPYCWTGKCKHVGCDSPAQQGSNGYCWVHKDEQARQERERANGSESNYSSHCKVAYCDRPVYRNGYCSYHYVE